jgi:hypothetical protein
MEVDYTRGYFLDDLFPEGNKPTMMTNQQFEIFKKRHKELMREKELEQQRIDDLKREKFQREQEIKDKIQYAETLAQEICERVSAGELLINICKDYHMPTIKRANQWLKLNSDFQALYNQSIQDRLNIFEEEVIRIADDMSSDYKEITIKRVTKRVIDPEVISRAKLRIDIRLKHLKAHRPARWGEQSTLNVNQNNADGPETMTDEEIERVMSELDDKESVTKEKVVKFK